MNEKIFYSDPHITRFNAKVLTCESKKDRTFDITLDRTAFFPEAGGQNADSGTIGTLPVLDVQIKNGIICHTVSHPITPGTEVEGNVDWNRRFDYMQQHSGEHIVSGLLHSRYGFNNVGFHLSDNEVTLDTDGTISCSELREIEAEANRAVYKDIPLKIYFPSPEELKNINYRSKIEIDGPVRIVEIPGFDICACCAPHVDRTGQIGIIKIINAMKHRGGTRINILCGKRALDDYSSNQDSVSSISVMLSSSPDTISHAVERLKEENLNRKNRAIALQQQLLQLQISQVPESLENVVLFFEELDHIAMRNTINLLCKSHSGYCSIFSGNSQDGFHFITGSLKKDCKALVPRLSEIFKARSGGTPQMIQGQISAEKEKIRTFFETL